MENLENERAIEYVQLKKYESILGMLFDCNEEMFVFYKSYSKQEEFPVKVWTSKKREW